MGLHPLLAPGGLASFRGAIPGAHKAWKAADEGRDSNPNPGEGATATVVPSRCERSARAQRGSAPAG